MVISMAKHIEKSVVVAPVAVAVADPVVVVASPVVKRAKNTLKITNKQKKMNPTEIQAWKDANAFNGFSAEVQAEINAKLAAPMTIRAENGTGGTKNTQKGEQVYTQEWAKALSLVGLLSAKMNFEAGIKLIDAEIPTRTDEKKAQIDAIKARMALDAAELAKHEAV